MVVDLNYEVVACTDIGVSKKVNQDSLHAVIADTEIGRVAMVVICDGVGGLARGEVASSMAVIAFKNWFSDSFPLLIQQKISEITLEVEWRKKIDDINQSIIAYGKENHTQMGTTLTAALFTANYYHIMQIGDTRAYEISDQVVQITKDQTLMEREVNLGHITREQAKTDSRRHVLLQCLGVNNNIEPAFEHGVIKKDAAYLLCSDGLYNKVSAQEIFGKCNPISNRNRDNMDSNVKELIHWSKSRGEKDNISAVLLRTM